MCAPPLATALRGPTASDLLAQLDVLASLELPAKPPILPFLLNPSGASAIPSIRTASRPALAALWMESPVPAA